MEYNSKQQEQYIMLIDSELVDTRWRNANADYIIWQDRDAIAVNLYLMDDPFEWLAQNDGFIIFDLSMNSILKNHETGQRTAKAVRSLSLREIKDASQGIYGRVYFDQYLNIPMDAGQPPRLGDHQPGTHSYSLPLIYAIAIKNILHDSDTFHFCVDAGDEPFFFTYDYIVRRNKYYNYSNNPFTRFLNERN